MSRVSELESEVATTRDRLNATIDEIQGRLTLSGMVNEVIGQTGVVKGVGDGKGMVHDLLRRFPVPVMLAAVGVGLLIYRAKKQGRPAPLEARIVAPTAGERRYDPDEPLGRPRIAVTDGRDRFEA